MTTMSEKLEVPTNVKPVEDMFLRPRGKKSIFFERFFLNVARL